MKLWYQSMLRESLGNTYHPVLRKIFDKFKDQGTEIEVHCIEKRGGLGVQYRYLEYLEAGEVMENVATAMRRGFDAFLIGNIADPGLRECREIANIPVLGLCESSLHLACLMGANYSLIGLGEKFMGRIMENVRRYGLENRLIGIDRLDMERNHNIHDGLTDRKVLRQHVAEFMKAADASVAKGAEVVIPAGGGAMTLLAYAGVHATTNGTPIVNGICALVKMGEMAVKMDRITGGHFTSKRLAYAPPGADQIDEIRKYYGNVYPTVKSKRKPAAKRARKP